MKFVLCEVEAEFDPERDRSFCKVTRPLQVFDYLQDAEEVMELFNPFYNYDLRVVESDKLHTTFR